MPELPEVQTIIADLNRKIKGDIITDFWSDWPKAIKGKTLAAFKKEIKGQKILGARRIGKNIFIDLSGGKTLYIHLKMTGHLLVKRAITKKQETKTKNYFNDRVNQYIHHIWYLGKNKTMEFSDVRKFAKIVLDDTEKINNLPEIKKLGVDAMSPQFTLNKFQEILDKRKNKAIGLVLMEQELIAGIGNIYRSEILFEAGIAPTRIIKKLKDSEIKKIYQAIKKVLEKAIRLRGTSDSDYRDTSGAPGNFQKVMRVYRQTGKKCPKCDTIIRRSTLGQRSIFFCSKCQK
jgi:formamidopyrimidine-DNA glycosylase